MSKIPLRTFHAKHKDVEFLTDDEDDFEEQPGVSKLNNSTGGDLKSKFQTILKHAKRKGAFNWGGALSKGIKRKNGNGEDKREVVEITDDESEDFSPKKENNQNTSLVKVETPQVLIHHRLMISSVSVDFPVRPYPCQTAVMSMVSIFYILKTYLFYFFSYKFLVSLDVND